MTQFTIEDLNKLIQICDIATKAGGLQIAQETLPLAAKMQQIAKEIQNFSDDLPKISE
jgi:hypothetical protein